MPIQHFTGNTNYNTMSCHAFALSGDPQAASGIDTRYNALGNYLIQGLSRSQKGLLTNMQSVTSDDVLNLRATGNKNKPKTMALLCKEFGFTPQPGSGIKLWGHFEDEQWLPEHMYVTINGRIYDTMPNQPVRKDTDNNGLNPPSHTGTALTANDVCSIEVAALKPDTMTAINKPDNEWANGLN